MEALYSDRDAATTPGGIRGLKVADLERVFPAYRIHRTQAGNVKPDAAPWDAHSKLSVFKELVEIKNVTDSTDKRLVLELHFSDNTSEYFHAGNILIVEDPITV